MLGSRPRLLRKLLSLAVAAALLLALAGCANDPPKACFEQTAAGPFGVGEVTGVGFSGQTLTFDASCSRPHKNASDQFVGSVAQYHWDLDGDGNFERMTTTPITTRSYDVDTGHRIAQMKVLDSSGHWSQLNAYGPIVLESFGTTPGEEPTSCNGAPVTIPGRTTHLTFAFSSVAEDFMRPTTGKVCATPPPSSCPAGYAAGGGQLTTPWVASGFLYYNPPDAGATCVSTAKTSTCPAGTLGPGGVDIGAQAVVGFLFHDPEPTGDTCAKGPIPVPACPNGQQIGVGGWVAGGTVLGKQLHNVDVGGICATIPTATSCPTGDVAVPGASTGTQTLAGMSFGPYSVNPTCFVQPTNTAPPTITGVARSGETLTAQPGTWTGSTPMIYDYRWYRCNATGLACDFIPEGVGASYRLTAVDVGTTLRVAVTAYNTGGESTSPKSQPSGVVTGSPVDTTDPILQVSGSLRARAGKGLYDATDSLTVRVTDEHTETRTGTVEVKILANDQVVDTGASVCATAACSLDHSWTLAADLFADGELRLKVIASDPAGNTSEDAWSVLVDRRGSIYQATELLDETGSGERVEAGLEAAKLDVRQARRVDDEWLKTRDRDEVRTRSRASEQSPGAEDAYAVHQGTDENDPNLPVVAGMIEERDNVAEGSMTQEETVTLASALGNWQTPPPAHGQTATVYAQVGTIDGTSEQMHVRLWVENATGLPLKEVAIAVATGEHLFTRAWNYDPMRLEDNEVPADFFRAEPPAHKGMEQQRSDRGRTPVGTVADQETSSQFQGYGLGASVTAGGDAFCLAGSTVVTQRVSSTTAAGAPDPALGPTDQPDGNPAAPHTTVAAAYERVVDGGCTARIDSPPLQVFSMARASSEAAAWRAVYTEQGTAVAADPSDEDVMRGGIAAVTLFGAPTTAYVIAQGAMTSTLVDVGDATVLIDGPYTKAELDTLLNELEAL